jgi:hypothetical protein
LYSYTHFVVDTTDPYYREKYYLTYQRNGTCLMPITIQPSPSNLEMRYIDFINDSTYSETLADFSIGACSGPPYDTIYVKKQTESQLVLLRVGNIGGLDSNLIYKTFRHYNLETYSK